MVVGLCMESSLVYYFNDFWNIGQVKKDEQHRWRTGSDFQLRVQIVIGKISADIR